MFFNAFLNPQKTFEFIPDDFEWARIIRVVRSMTAKRIALRVDPARGDICLVIPNRASEKKAWAFAASQRDWIEKQQAKLLKPVPFIHGAAIPVLGIERTIRVETITSRTTEFELTDSELIVRTRRPDPSTNIRNYLYELLEQTVLPMARTKAETIDRRITELQLRDTRTRWGSCGHDGKVMLCWRLIFAPEAVIDYVVAHEIAHLKYMSHGPRFWALCEKLSADFSAKDWLKVNGDKLLQYGQKST